MPQTIPIASVREYMTRHFMDVFETMLSLKAVPSSELELPHSPERVCGSVGFAGQNVNGAVYVHLSASFASRVAAAMLGLSPEEISGEAEVNDAVGEVGNMLTGGLKSWLSDCDRPCAVSTPAIIRGAAFAIEPSPDVEREWLAFACGEERVAVEVHIKFL